MTRGKSRSPRACACFAAVLATACAALVLPAAAPAAPAAQEQYILELDGVDRSDIGTDDPIVARSQRAGPVGVVGEDEGGVTQLGALRSAAVAPAGIVLIFVLAAAAVLALRRSRRPQR